MVSTLDKVTARYQSARRALASIPLDALSWPLSPLARRGIPIRLPTAAAFAASPDRIALLNRARARARRDPFSRRLYPPSPPPHLLSPGAARRDLGD